MSDLTTRIKACPALMEAMGQLVPWHGRLLLHGHFIDFDNDDCPGSSWLVTRGMTLLREKGEIPSLGALTENWALELNTFQDSFFAPTMVSAVALALLGVYES